MAAGVSDPSKPGAHTAEAQTKGTKQVKIEHLNNIKQPSDLSHAPPSRIYTKDYTKVQPEKDDTDDVSPFLGNPLRW